MLSRLFGAKSVERQLRDMQARRTSRLKRKFRMMAVVQTYLQRENKSRCVEVTDEK